MPRGQESKAKTALVSMLKKSGHYARRYEDTFGVGILDLEVILKGDNVVWKIEAKIMKGIDQKFGMSERQYIEAIEFARTNNPAVIVVLAGYDTKEKLWYITAPTKVAYRKDCVKQEQGEHFGNLLKRWRGIHG
ncbi:hypothetical protein PQB35_gp30 [Ochrobactrum phage vB_OspP_OH]|uniref:Uncharacterized protein n=1 Tax=Ochrobactrum phage vB_OspP_OH TaxID=2712957 RepID=A0A6G6XXJ4_9CAUD|nr:hypothetical protein PQB35_gp30 [Ochrobactrum phage vB_OspP_OH]QIG66086.1 hypothetical protein phiOH_p30 [Ochrobactrum phage vB_OspP_OH]